MTGLKYFRMIANITQEQLAHELGVSTPVIMRHELGLVNTRPAKLYLKISGILKVSIAELIAEYPDGSVPNAYVMPQNHEAHNIVDLYKLQSHHTTRSLGALLGVSRQTISNQCCAEIPDSKYISQLAGLEGISLVEFLSKYKVA